MATVFDVAKYILEKRGEMTAMKLQKLVYYAQAWSLVWDNKPIFPEVIQAWANGPVVPELYMVHRGMFIVAAPLFEKGNSDQLTREEKETIDAMLETYGDKSPQWLSELTHNEDPWKNARRGLENGQRGYKEISYSDMAEYYESLL